MEVKSVSAPESKSIQEQEQEFEAQRAEKEAQEAAAREVEAAKEKEVELDDTQVLGYFKNKYGKEVSSIDELFKAPEVKEQELPEAVAGFAKFHKETKRGISDYMKFTRNVDDMDELDLIKEFRRGKDPDATDEEIEFEIREEFELPKDLDEEDQEYKRILLKRKKEARQAKKFIEEQKEKYYKPVESAGSIPAEEQEDYKAYKQYIESSKSEEEANNRKAQVFREKTDKVFSEGFNGFNVKFDDKSIVFKPGDAEELKNLQSSPANFIKQHLDEDGTIKDAEAYHLALAMGMNPVKAAKFFYEKGQADARESDNKKMKNVRLVPNNSGFSGSGLKTGEVTAVSTPSRGGSLKIKSRNKV